MPNIVQANVISHAPRCSNEPIFDYRSGSPERKEIEKMLEYIATHPVEIPVVINGKEIRTGDVVEIRAPHDHSLLLGTYHKASAEHVNMAIEACRDNWEEWSGTPWEERISIFLKAAELLAGQRRALLNAVTMLGQSKTVHQAEIDAACELIDFWRFNATYMQHIYAEQPISPRSTWNWLEYRALEGFVFAVTPFNFTSIAGNLPTAPAMMGNTVVWKPASSAVLNAHYILQILNEAGLPEGVINMVPGSGATIGNAALNHPNLAGIHFTGSTEVFQGMWKTVGSNIERYKSYPRIVGETGGKDFIFAHPIVDIDALVTGCVRGAYEYQGQKCSAASRAYIPRSIWAEFQDKLLAMIKDIKMGDPRDFKNFMGAVIDRNAFETIKGYIDYAKDSHDAKILIGGDCDDSKGFFIEPTVILTENPHFKTMEEEIFGPVLSIYIYEDNKMEETLKILDQTSIYALTGAVFARNRKDIIEISSYLRNCAGNFYINDKPTGAVVGQQPFGGARKSGTNDKAGSSQNLFRWVSVRAVKENFDPPHDYKYPYME
jgi:1-pyrroline-5-carboxylate dehydrogenase